MPRHAHSEARPDTAVPEGALLVRLREGDEQAFVLLVRSHHASLVRLARVFVADGGAAEEVAQDTWLGVLTGLRGFEGRSSIKTWIFRILVNRARTRGERDGRLLPFSALGEPLDDDTPLADRFTSRGSWAQPPFQWQERDPEQILLDRETAAALEEAIAALPPAQRAVLTLRDIEGLGSEEVCNILDISETNHRVILHRARTRVRAALEAHLGRRRNRHP